MISSVSRQRFSRQIIFVPFSLLLFFILTLIPLEKKSPESEDLSLIINQKSGLEIQLEDLGWQWKEEDIKGNEKNGEITFSDTKWLMYLIHWGPIQVPKITVDYVRKRMLKMWGVEFQFTGKEGLTKMAGHDAAWAEAYGTNKSFYTRFIIWNCPQSGREFIADTNYNIRRKTPEEDFDREMRSARTVQCHEGAATEYFPDITKNFESKKYDISFYYPEEWFIFDSPYYVPFPEYEGIRSRKMGSLLGLCSDQNISVTLEWFPLDESEKRESFMGIEQRTLDFLTKKMKSQKDIQSIQNHGMEEFNIHDKKIFKIWGVCQFKEPEDEREKAFFTGEGIYQAAQWDLEKKKKKILVILMTKQYRYGTAISSPCRHPQDMFLNDLIFRIK